jgi:hypothetical protein
MTAADARQSPTPIATRLRKIIRRTRGNRRAERLTEIQHRLQNEGRL